MKIGLVDRDRLLKLLEADRRATAIVVREQSVAGRPDLVQAGRERIGWLDEVSQMLSTPAGVIELPTREVES